MSSDGKPAEAMPGACGSDLDYQAQLNWRTWFKTVTLDGTSELGGERVYVVTKVLDDTHREIDYISTKSFLVIRRVSIEIKGGKPEETIYLYDDYRDVDGVMIPMRTSFEGGLLGKAVARITRIKFDADTPLDGEALVP